MAGLCVAARFIYSGDDSRAERIASKFASLGISFGLLLISAACVRREQPNLQQGCTPERQRSDPSRVAAPLMNPIHWWIVYQRHPPEPNIHVSRDAQALLPCL